MKKSSASQRRTPLSGIFLHCAASSAVTLHMCILASRTQKVNVRFSSQCLPPVCPGFCSHFPTVTTSVLTAFAICSNGIPSSARLRAVERFACSLPRCLPRLSPLHSHRSHKRRKAWFSAPHPRSSFSYHSRCDEHAHIFVIYSQFCVPDA